MKAAMLLFGKQGKVLLGEMKMGRTKSEMKREIGLGGRGGVREIATEFTLCAKQTSPNW
jgi:hypothetical protein